MKMVKIWIYCKYESLSGNKLHMSFFCVSVLQSDVVQLLTSRGFGYIFPGKNHLTKTLNKDVIKPIKDVMKPIKDVIKPIKDVIKPIKDVIKPIKDVIKPIKHDKPTSDSDDLTDSAKETCGKSGDIDESDYKVIQAEKENANNTNTCDSSDTESYVTIENSLEHIATEKVENRLERGKRKTEELDDEDTNTLNIARRTLRSSGKARTALKRQQKRKTVIKTKTTEKKDKLCYSRTTKHSKKKLNEMNKDKKRRSADSTNIEKEKLQMVENVRLVDVSEINCDFCNAKIDNGSNLKIHMEEEHGVFVPEYECRDCYSQFDNSKSIPCSQRVKVKWFYVLMGKETDRTLWH